MGGIFAQKDSSAVESDKPDMIQSNGIFLIPQHTAIGDFMIVVDRIKEFVSEETKGKDGDDDKIIQKGRKQIYFVVFQSVKFNLHQKCQPEQTQSDNHKIKNYFCFVCIGIGYFVHWIFRFLPQE